MTTTVAAASVERASALRPILLGGLVVGVLDIIYAFVANGLYGRGPVSVLHSVASGLLGRAAYDGGLATAALGALLHFFIATVATAVYYVASRRVTFLTTHAVLFGALYGIAVYLFMNFVVLPLSAVPFKITHTLASMLIGFAGHIVCVGLPISLAVKSAARSR